MEIRTTFKIGDWVKPLRKLDKRYGVTAYATDRCEVRHLSVHVTASTQTEFYSIACDDAGYVPEVNGGQLKLDRT